MSAPLSAEEPVAVDVELVLAVDSSFSVGGREQDIQRIGYIAAFRDPAVIRALTGGFHGRSAVAYVEWADQDFQRLVIGWRLIGDAAAAEAFADELSAAPIGRSGSTSLSEALNFSALLFDANRFEGERRVIDISGDGANNDGPPVVGARERIASGGITINALPLLTPEADASPVDLADYYRGCVIGGPGAFSHPVEKSGDVASAIKRKMVMELAAASLTASDAAIGLGPDRGDVDCLIGEKLRREEYLRMLRSITNTPERWAPDESTWPTPSD